MGSGFARQHECTESDISQMASRDNKASKSGDEWHDDWNSKCFNGSRRMRHSIPNEMKCSAIVRLNDIDRLGTCTMTSSSLLSKCSPFYYSESLKLFQILLSVLGTNFTPIEEKFRSYGTCDRCLKLLTK